MRKRPSVESSRALWRSDFVLLCVALVLSGAVEAVGQDSRPGLPASSEDLWRRWLKLIARPDIAITPARVEGLFAVPLSEQAHSSGARETTYDATVEYTAHRYWYLALTLSPDKTTAVLEWSAPFGREESYDCVDAAKAKQDLSAIGFGGGLMPWRLDPHPTRSPTPPDYKQFWYLRSLARPPQSATERGHPGEEIRAVTGHWRTLRPPVHDRLFLCQYTLTRGEAGSR